MPGLKRDARLVDEEEGRRMLKIGDVSKRSGIGIEALRFYEKSGLLDKPSRTFGGYRVYGEEVLEREADRAFEWLKMAYQERFSLLVLLELDPHGVVRPRVHLKLEPGPPVESFGAVHV